nr:immunoglobulin light chain junction region [Macaca mulatta]
DFFCQVWDSSSIHVFF